MRSIALDLGIHLDLRVLTDATAAIGICRRRGLGRVRHLAVADLWVQDKVRAKDFQLLKVAGRDNPADLMTKHLDQGTMHRHLAKLGLSPEQGRPETAPTLTHSVVPTEDGASWASWPIWRSRRRRRGGAHRS